MRILLAEDDPMLSKAIERTLKNNAMATDIFVDGKSAVSAAFAADYDLILLDLGLPRLDGIEVLKPFKRLAGQEQEGSGLGLAIVAELSQKLGAKLKLQKSNNYQSGLLVSLSFNNLTVF